MNSLAILALLSFAPQGGDVVRLETGSEVRGEILRETDDYIELEVGDGMVLGFEKSKATAILRASQGAVVAEPSSAPRGQDRNEWFVLHDAVGHVVGKLHETLVHTPEGIRIGEEWTFGRGEDRVAVTVLETLGHDGSPVTCFYHERVVDRRDRVVSERVVRGVVEGGRLKVTRKTMDGSAKRTYEFTTSARFPLELRRELRESSGRRIGHYQVYDPKTERWSGLAVDAGAFRTVEHGGDSVRVRVIALETDGDQCIEWFNGAKRCIRREVNGTSLVAVPTTESRARAFNEVRTTEFESSLVADTDGRFAMWLPNPNWSDTSSGAGEVSMRYPARDASMSLVLLDQLDENALLDTAVDSVERWVRLAHPKIDFGARQHTIIRDTAAVRVRGEYETRRPGEAIRRICDIVVFALADGRFLSFCADLPRANRDELEHDIERVLSRLELHRQGFAPDLQGPVSQR